MLEKIDLNLLDELFVVYLKELKIPLPPLNVISMKPRANIHEKIAKR